MADTITWQGNWPGTIPSLEVDSESLGLILVDFQYSCAHPDRTPARLQEGGDPELFARWSVRIGEMVVPNARRLLSWFRIHQRPIVFTRVGSLLPDARDQHPKRRLAWLRPGPAAPAYRSPLGGPDYDILEALAPLPTELVVDKNSSGAFNSSAIDLYLQHLGVRTIVIAGVSTFACVDNTARDAADRGYNVILVEDACAGAAGNEAAHDATVRTFGRYFGAVKHTGELLAELDALVEVPRAATAARA
jgi:biuret amidohydrolase